MTSFELIGFFFVILTCAIGSAVLLMCACFGAWIFKEQWKKGFQWDMAEEDVRKAVES